MFKTAYNPTDSPVVIDDLGHSIGGREWGAVETTDDATKAAIDGGLLVLVDEPGRGASVNDRAAGAFARTAEIGERSKAFAGLDRDALFELAVEHEVVADDAERTPTKGELVTLLVFSDVEPPAKTPKPARSSGGSQTDKSEES